MDLSIVVHLKYRFLLIIVGAQLRKVTLTFDTHVFSFGENVVGMKTNRGKCIMKMSNYIFTVIHYD